MWEWSARSHSLPNRAMRGNRGSISIVMCILVGTFASLGIALTGFVHRTHSNISYQLELDACLGKLGLELGQSLTKLASLNQVIVNFCIEMAKVALSSGKDMEIEHLEKFREVMQAVKTQDKIIALWDQRAKAFSGCRLSIDKKVKVPLLSDNLSRNGHHTISGDTWSRAGKSDSENMKEKLLVLLSTSDLPILRFSPVIKTTLLQMGSKGIYSAVEISGGDDGISEKEPRPWKAKYISPK